MLPAEGELKKHRLQVAHTCIAHHDCVDPKHLTLATQAVNLQERYASGRIIEAAKDDDYSSHVAPYDSQSFTGVPQCVTASPTPLSDTLVTPCGHVTNTLCDQELTPCPIYSVGGHLDDSPASPEDPYDSI